MKWNLKLIGIVTAAVLGGLVAGWIVFSGKSPEAGHEHQMEQAAQATWTCAMHPQVRADEPGQCPICGMDLIPVGKEGSENIDESAIAMSETAMKLARVQTSVVEEAMPSKTVRMTGKVMADERKVYSQTAHIPGRIESLEVNFTGEFVEKGQVLANVYSPELVTAQKELFEAKKVRDNQSGLYRAVREKLKNWKLTEEQIDRLETSGEVRENFPVLSDFSGTVIEKMVSLGDHVHSGSKVFRVADLSTVWVLLDVYESGLPWVSVGDKVQLTFESLPGEKFSGKIVFVDPVMNAKTRVAEARVELENHNNLLKPGMFVTASLLHEISPKQNVVAVPKSAVMWTGERSVVYVIQRSEGQVNFRMREVKLGPAMSERYIVEEGLTKGEEIVTNGTFSVDAAAQLAGKPSMMNPEGGPVSTGHDHGNMKSGGPDTDDHRDHNATPAPDIDKFNRQIGRVVNSYLELKDAFVASDVGLVKEKTENLSAAIHNVDMKLVEGKAHQRWMKLSDQISVELKGISTTGDIEEQRRHFSNLSSQVLDLIRQFDAATEKVDKLYYQFCPMAGEGGAYWLSDQLKIRNPYFGDTMLGCGETTDTISIGR